MSTETTKSALDIDIDPKVITTEQAQAYLNRRGAGCPVCKSNSYEGGNYHFDTGTLYQPMSCNECGAEWDDAYELDRIVSIDGAHWDGETYE